MTDKKTTFKPIYQEIYMTDIKAELIKIWPDYKKTTAKPIYQEIDDLNVVGLKASLKLFSQPVDNKMTENQMRFVLKSLVKFYLFKRKIPKSPYIKLDLVEVISTEKTIEFRYMGGLYIYKFKTNHSSGLAYVYKGEEMIYGPYEKQRTPEGIEVYEAIWKQLISK